MFKILFNAEKYTHKLSEYFTYKGKIFQKYILYLIVIPENTIITECYVCWYDNCYIQ